MSNLAIAASQEDIGALSVRDLTIEYRLEQGYHRAVDGLSFDIKPGRTLALVGESGSGKSTVALSILRLLNAASTRMSGAITFQGENLLQIPDSRMRDVRGGEIGMIFQEPMTSLNPVLTVGQQIVETLLRHRPISEAEARKIGIELLSRVRIPLPEARFDEYPHRMSGGMRQRIMIAMAIACRPKLLIADEPSTALDVTVQAQILAVLKLLQQEEGMSILFITHDLGVVAEIADDICVMKDGIVVEQGTTEEVLTRPQADYTRSLLKAVPVFGALNQISRPVRFSEEIPEKDAMPVAAMARTAEDSLLRVENLVTRYDVRKNMLGTVAGRIHAVENVSFDVYPGETLALVGESGCGKSTIGRSVLRLESPDSGKVILDGEDLLALTESELRARRPKIQMVFQDPYGSLNPRLTIAKAIGEPLRINGLAKRNEIDGIVNDLLRQVELPESFKTRYPDELSGGQRQRVCLARALAFRPKLIVADEAVSALDASTKAQVIDLMIDLQERMGLSYIFISHDIALVERMSHRVAVMYLGEIVEIGTRQDVLMNPQHPYTQRLLSGVPVVDPARRHRPIEIDNFELKSPLRPLAYVAPDREWRELGNGHRVQVWADDWR